MFLFSVFACKCMEIFWERVTRWQFHRVSVQTFHGESTDNEDTAWAGRGSTTPTERSDWLSGAWASHPTLWGCGLWLRLVKEKYWLISRARFATHVCICLRAAPTRINYLKWERRAQCKCLPPRRLHNNYIIKPDAIWWRAAVERAHSTRRHSPSWPRRPEAAPRPHP